MSSVIILIKVVDPMTLQLNPLKTRFEEENEMLNAKVKVRN